MSSSSAHQQERTTSGVRPYGPSRARRSRAGRPASGSSTQSTASAERTARSARSCVSTFSPVRCSTTSRSFTCAGRDA
ncbi:hypothetical protein C5C56_12440 [Rathayibacter sp. AY1D1]|nr:hypothetical protein C5C56_12440 [Rathayibacter sp. AY1D1]